MNNHWLLQCNLINQDQVERVRQAAIECGDKVSSVRLTPFSGEMEFLDGEPPNHVIPYGSNALIQNGIRLGWPNVFANDNFRVSKWVTKHPYMVNRVPKFIKAGYVELDSSLTEESYFVRPNEDFKAFAGQVIATENLVRWMKSVRLLERSASPNGSELNADTVIAISEPKDILCEWRWFVVGGRVVDGCRYMFNNSRNVSRVQDPQQTRRTQHLVHMWLPHETCVVDTAYFRENDDGMFGVLEYNNLNTSGFYDHDIRKVVRAVSDYVTSKKDKT